jgi:hypothetical protein
MIYSRNCSEPVLNNAASFEPPAVYYIACKKATKGIVPTDNPFIIPHKRSGSGLFADLDDLPLIVASASLADSMRSHESAALAALDKSRSRHLPLRVLHISS